MNGASFHPDRSSSESPNRNLASLKRTLPDLRTGSDTLDNDSNDDVDAVVAQGSNEVPEKPLNNDRDQSTIEAESRFLSDFQFEEFTEWKFVAGKYRTVVHSRTKNAYFALPTKTTTSKTTVTIGDFKRYFSDIGHTLTVDTTKSYAYVCALDVDCAACKQTRRQEARELVRFPHEMIRHLDEATVERVRFHLEKLLKQLINLSRPNIKEKLVKVVLFKREKGTFNCGFHTYTNVQLSLPFNALILDKMTAILDAERSHAVIDMPTRLPLPYSAKSPREPYVQYLISHDEAFVNEIFVLGSREYFDNFRYLTRQRLNEAKRTGKIIASIKSAKAPYQEYRYVVNCNTPYERLKEVRFPDLPSLKREVEDDNDDISIRVLNLFLNLLREMTLKIEREGSMADPPTNDENIKRLKRDLEFDDGTNAFATNGKDSLEEFIKQFEESNYGELSQFYRKFDATHLGNTEEHADEGADNTDDEEDDGNDDDDDGDDDDRGSSNSSDSNERSTMRGTRAACAAVKRFTARRKRRDDPLGIEDSLMTNHDRYRRRQQRRWREQQRVPSSPSSTSSQRFSLLKEQKSFVNITAKWHNGLSLQHYLVALCKALKCEDFDDIKTYIGAIYAAHSKPGSPTERLLTMFSPLIVICYKASYNDILCSLGRSYRMGFDIDETVESRIAKMTLELLQNRLNKPLSTTEDLEQEIKKSKGTRAHWEEVILECYAEALSALSFLFIIQSVWYLYVDQGYYSRLESYSSLPWIYKFARQDSMKRILEAKANTMFSTEGMWSHSDLMFVTNVGIFSAVTGLYCTKTTLLRYPKQRNYAIWNTETTTYKMHCKQNEFIMKMEKITEGIEDIFWKRSREIYMYFFILPAVLDLPTVYSIGESSILPFLSILETFEDLGPLRVILEFFRIEPTFICLIALFSAKEDFFKSYRSAVNECFEMTAGHLPSVEDWRGYLETLLIDCTWDKSLKNHTAALKSLQHPDIRSGCFADENFLVFCSIQAMCLIKSWPTYRPLLEAIAPDYAEGNMCSRESDCLDRSRLPPEYAKMFAENGTISQKFALDNAIVHIFGADLPPFHRVLINAGIMLCMSADFEEDTLRELLMSISFVFTVSNSLKKLIVFFGNQDTGKSFFCDLITEMCLNAVGRVTDLQSSQNRNNISVRSNVIIVNEMESLNANMIKSITGNDASSSKIFFKLSVEMMMTQAPAYVATNGYPKFHSSMDKNQKVDRTTVDRLHAIQLRGRHIQETDKKHRTDSLFSSVLEKKYPRHLIVTDKVRIAKGVSWLAWSAYFRHRDCNYRPVLDMTRDDVLSYQQQSYINNNSFYAFLFRCGIQDEPGFRIRVDDFLDHVRVGIEDRSTIINSMESFKAQFKEQYSVDIGSSEFVADFQLIAFIKHVRNLMHVRATANGVISRESLEKRASEYADKENQENARRYFNRSYKENYDKIRGVFVGIEFANPIQPYANNNWNIANYFYASRNS